VKPAAELDLETGALSVAPETYRALLYATGDSAEAPPGHGEHVAALEAVGALENGQPHVLIATALAVPRSPTVTLRIDRAQASAQGWMTAQAASFLFPTAEDRLELTCVSSRFVPAMVARLVELEPRPMPEGPALELAAGDLAQLIAGSQQPAPMTAPGAADALPRVRGHWLAQASHANGRRGHCEVLDTDAGLYKLSPGDAHVAVQPTTPTQVWRRLVKLTEPPQEGT